ncbi:MULTISPECIES: peroxiredoxin [unclassified Arthrobacter]|uniref:peroxiredoxin n=1 Tax=unclassified Arthrobacter TaxID=235627 RepID=UPI0014908AC1|nr:MULTISPECIES: peroxiredoxin [unclassified Arthrobacter]MBE0010184.1 peroxiredoxin [Arthrobacter sp. AET 35A]NOJ64000.1 peroxiredoxin [Arthrobacter sp. 147(2020)]
MSGLPLMGEPAPDFALSNQFGETVRLSDLRGTPVAVVFYPFAFSGVCTGELCELRDNLALFDDDGVRLLAVSVDSKYTLRAYAQDQGFSFDLLADFWPHGDVAARYGAFDADRGYAERATFLIDAQGVIVATLRSELGQPRPLEDYRAALTNLTGRVNGVGPSL